jgi:hypothetical protein
MEETIEPTRLYKLSTKPMQEASTTRSSFRAVFSLPLSHKKIKERLKHLRTKLVMIFPNNIVSFIPDNHWYGGTRRAGCYKEKHTHMVLLMYESE